MGQVYRVKPAMNADGEFVDSRVSRYGDQLTIPMTGHALADEGSYFIITNPTPGTGLATVAAPTTLADTSPFILIKNNDATGGKRVYFDYLKLTCTAAGTAGASLRYNMKVDNIARYTSGTTLTSTPQNVNMDSGEATICNAYAGPLVAAAASASVRLLGGGILKISIPVIGDTYVLKFGGVSQAVGSGVATIAHTAFTTHPVVIGPQQTFLFHLWLPSQSAASSYEVEMGWWER